MGNCQMVHLQSSNEIQSSQPQIQPQQQPTQKDANKSRQIFNHNAKDHSSYQSNQQKDISNFDSPSNDQIIPKDLQGETFEEQQQFQSPYYSNNNNNSQLNQQTQNGYIEQPMQIEHHTQNNDMNDLHEFRKELEQEAHQLELNPPLLKKDLPPFNYGENPVYPQEYRIEMRPAFRLPDGSTYVGEWNKQTIHGKGVMESENGKYEGYWEEGKKQGRGRYTYADGDVFEGDWNHDRIEGIGTYYYNNGIIYNGQWKNEKRNGFGKEIFPNSASYEGEFINDQKDGQGVFIWKDSTKYTGQFRQNKINGEGFMEYSNGRKYRGLYKDGLMHGRGKFEWADKRVYEGDYQTDRKHGQGKLTYPDGRIYNGSWVNGQMDGEGMISVGNHLRKGYWVDGKRVKWLD